MTTRIETFAEQHRLRVSRDECSNQVIQGRRGQLYFDGPDLCLMVLDGAPAIRSKWAALGGSLWMGDISKNAQGKRVQDVKITGIPLENARLAMRLVGAAPRRVLSEAHRKALAASNAATRFRPKATVLNRHGKAISSLDGPEVMACPHSSGFSKPGSIPGDTNETTSSTSLVLRGLLRRRGGVLKHRPDRQQQQLCAHDQLDRGFGQWYSASLGYPAESGTYASSGLPHHWL